MVSGLGAQASRVNGARSQGPVTPDGKRRSALNAMTHGIFSRQVVLDCEDRYSYEQLAAGIFEHYRPVGGMELMLADRIAQEAWRLQRIARIEREIFDCRMVQLQRTWDQEDGLAKEDEQAVGLPADSPLEGDAPPASKRQVRLGQAARMDFLNSTMGNLRLYETRIERSMYRAVAELRRVQAEAMDRGAATAAGANCAGGTPAPQETIAGRTPALRQTSDAIAAARLRQAQIDLQLAAMEDRRQETLRQIEQIEQRLRDESLRQGRCRAEALVQQRLCDTAGRPFLDETPELASIRQAQIAGIQADLAVANENLQASRAAFAAMSRELVELEQRLEEQEGESERVREGEREVGRVEGPKA